MKPGRIGLALIASAILATIAIADTKDPPVPPGLDPGGVAVALIGPGIDYTDPEIAARLARDGEGELIGYDLVDGDRRPAARGNDLGVSTTALALRLIGAAPDVALAPFRIDEIGQVKLVRAIGMITETRARIAVLVSSDASEPDWLVLDAASARFPEMLFIVPNLGGPLGAGASKPAELPNLILTDALVQEGEQSRLVSFRPGVADVAVTVTDQLEGHDVGCDRGCVSVGDLLLHEAAIAVAARAATLVSKEASLKGAALKHRLMEGAIPWPNDSSGPRYGQLR